MHDGENDQLKQKHWDYCESFSSMPASGKGPLKLFQPVTQTRTWTKGGLLCVYDFKNLQEQDCNDFYGLNMRKKCWLFPQVSQWSVPTLLMLRVEEGRGNWGQRTLGILGEWGIEPGVLDHVTFELQSLDSSCLCLCVALDRQQA